MESQIQPEPYSLLAELGEKGFAITHLKSTDPIIFRQIAQAMGTVQRHARSDDTDIATIGMDDASGLSHNHFALRGDFVAAHSDGSFVSRFFAQGQGIFRAIMPPSVILIQEVRPASHGGQFFVVPCRQLIERMLVHRPEFFIQLVTTPVTYVRDSDAAENVYILSRRLDGTFAIRFRDDHTLFAPPELTPALDYIRGFVRDEAQWVTFPSVEGQIIVVDNMSMLHGQLAYSDSAKLSRRLWLAELGRPLVSRAVSLADSFEESARKYRPASGEPGPVNQLPLGIRLSPGLTRIADALCGRTLDRSTESPVISR